MIFGTAPAFTPLGRVCVFSCPWDIPGPNPNSKTLLCPFPPSPCPPSVPSLTRGPGARQAHVRRDLISLGAQGPGGGGLAALPCSKHSNAPIVWGWELGEAEVGGHRTPCSPHIPHFPQDQSRVFQRRRHEPSLVLVLCRSWKRMWMALEGGSFVSRGILGSRSWDVWLLPEYPSSPSFPIPLPAVSRCFGSLGLTRVWEGKAAQPGSLWPHCPRAP